MRISPYYLRRFRELGLREGSQQARQIMANRALRICGRLYDRYVRVDPDDAYVLKLCGFTSSAEFGRHFRQRTTPRFFNPNVAARLDEFRSSFPDETLNLIRRADLVMNHTFDLLGSGPVNLDALKNGDMPVVGRNGQITSKAQPIGYLPWHTDFKSHTIWDPSLYYKTIGYGNLAGVDVKVPWELSRFQHLLVLGQAYLLSKNEDYAKEFTRQIRDWIDTNPCRYGVNWSCTMEVGIRVVNWIWAFYYFREAPSLDDAFLLKFIRSIYLHAQFIRSNLEFRTGWVNGKERRLNSNHYLSDLVGLLYISVLFPEFHLNNDKSFAAAELELELFEQTSADGTDYEHSTSYHRLVLEIFLSGFLLLKVNGHTIGGAVRERLHRMGTFVCDYLRADGTAPQIGDSDDGRLHPLAQRPPLDHRYLLQVAADLLDRTELCQGPMDPEVWWWTGSSTRGATPQRQSCAYPDGGCYIMRDAKVHVFVSAATVGMCGFGSHSHNDLLSFEYWYDGNALIVDPGTYVYTPDPTARNLFRSTSSHNTVRIDDVEINPMEDRQLFQMRDLAKVVIHEWLPGQQIDVFDAEHSGYARLPGLVHHRRQFKLNKTSGELFISDLVQGSGSHLVEWFFHLHPDVVVEQQASTFILTVGKKTFRLVTSDPGVNATIVEGSYSPSYGIREKAAVIVFRTQCSVPVTMDISIGPVN
jgi:uncharacterized heparinase superfamily protein